MFPHPDDPKGDPETWTREEMRRWLAAVRVSHVSLPRHFLLTLSSETSIHKTATQGTSSLSGSRPILGSHGGPTLEREGELGMSRLIESAPFRVFFFVFFLKYCWVTVDHEITHECRCERELSFLLCSSTHDIQALIMFKGFD